MEEKNFESKELQEYLKSSLSAIKKSIKESGFEITEPVEFNLAIINTKEGSGGLKIYIAKAEGGLKSEELSHIKIKVSPIIEPTKNQFKDNIHLRPENSIK